MVKLGAVELAGITVIVGMVATSGTSLVFAQQQAPCGEQPYVYNMGCAPLGTAQLYAAVLVGGVVALAVACGASGIKRRMLP